MPRVIPNVYHQGVVPHGATFVPSTISQSNALMPLGADDTVRTESAYFDWAIGDKTYRLTAADYHIMLLAPENVRGLTYSPGTKNYAAIAQSGLENHKENQGWMEWGASIAVYSARRAAFEEAVKRGLAARPELAEPVRPTSQGGSSDDGLPRGESKFEAWHVIAALGGAAIIGSGVYGYMRYKKQTKAE